MEYTDTLRPNEEGKYFSSCLYDTMTGEWYLPPIAPPPLPHQDLITMANNAAYLRRDIVHQETEGFGKWKHRIARLHDRRAGRLKARPVSPPSARPINVKERRRARRIKVSLLPPS
jgi:hypothetical protein